VSSGCGNDAEGASVPAAILYLQIRPGLLGIFSEGQRSKFRVGKIIVQDGRQRNKGLRSRLVQNLRGECDSRARHQRLVAVADNGIHSGQRRDLFGSALGITTCDDHASVGIAAVHPPDPRARLAVRLSRNAAGIDDNDGSSIGVHGRRESLVAQARSDGFAIRAARPASEVFNVIFCHVA
jgi:hypothetical protein